QTFAADAYSVSGGAMIGSATDYFQDQAPIPPSIVGIVLPAIFLPANKTITPVNLAALASDPQGDTLSVSASGLPAGLSISSGNRQGSTTGNAITQVTFTWTNASGESASTDYNLVIGQVTPPNLVGLYQSDIEAILAGLYLSATFGVQDDAATAGTALAQNPP